MTYGFVIIRHVNSETTDQYWKKSYQCIRKYYNEPILIVDDHSKSEFLNENIKLINCQIINSEFSAGKGEILAYYYFHKTQFANKAIIIHDSVFMNLHIDFNQYKTARALWSFPSICDNDPLIITFIRYLKNANEVITIFNNKNTRPRGCFGVMSVITWEFLDKINTYHDFFSSLIPKIECRSHRMTIERIFSCICELHTSEYLHQHPIVNDIFCQGWGLTYEQYLSVDYSHLPIVKVWTGR